MYFLGHQYKNGEPVGVDERELLRHLYVLGKTGSGKSTVLLHLLTSWIKGGNGCALIDPHGDLLDDVINCLPTHRVSDVILVDLTDESFPFSWNPLYRVAIGRRPVVAQGIVAALRGVWRDSWGPRMEYILINALRLLLGAQQESLLGLQRVLVDSGYRSHLLQTCEDPVVSRFWTTEFNVWDDRFRREAIAPIQNKIGQFLSDPRMRAILGQRKSRVDLRHAMDSGKIILVNLSKGLVGESSANLFGSLLVASLHDAALSRADIPERERRPFILTLDEFHNVTSDRFAASLSEARKYGLGLVLAHQFLDQLIPEVRSAVLGNAGTVMVFRIGGSDATVFSQEFGGDWPPGRFSELPAYRAVLFKGCDIEIPIPQIICTSLPEFTPLSDQQKGSMLRNSRNRHACPEHLVTQRIDAWLARSYGPGKTGRTPRL